MRLEAALSGNLEATLRADAERIAKARRNAIGKTTRSVQLAARETPVDPVSYTHLTLPTIYSV